MRFVVWVDGWQLQCCGDPFEVGGKIAWTLSDQPNRDRLATAVGPDVAARITHSEEHHGSLPDDLPATEGGVRKITSAFCRYAHGAGHRGEKIYYPVPGTVMLRKVTKATGWEEESRDLRFNGYVVELDVTEDAGQGNGWNHPG